VQCAAADSIEANQDRIVHRIHEADDQGARVIVFPEGTLCGTGDTNTSFVDSAIATICSAADERDVYVLFGGKSLLEETKKVGNWMVVADPNGRIVMRYEKLFDNLHARMPEVFSIDGVPCSAMICADRWLRGVEEIPIQQGARISFELSNNFSEEWVEPFQWYWNSSRARRNGVWGIFANSCQTTDQSSLTKRRGHGHSAVIDPAGLVVSAIKDDQESILISEIDVARATRQAALDRASHPAFRPFWQAGDRLQRGEKITAPELSSSVSPEPKVTIAVAQTSGDLQRMLSFVEDAKSRGADLVAFPAASSVESDLEHLQTAARKHRLVIVAGAIHGEANQQFNSAFVIGPDGSVLTRYDQLSATKPLTRGIDPACMWFTVKDVPGIVTLGDDAKWTELAELAAIAGARIHIHLDNDYRSDTIAQLSRLQDWATLSSFHMFSATANVIESAIWDDLRGVEERKAAVSDLTKPDVGNVKIYSPFSANLVTQAGTDDQLLIATRNLPSRNPHYPDRTKKFNPQMDDWYRLGASIVRQGLVSHGEPTKLVSTDQFSGPFEGGEFRGRIAWSADGNFNDPDDWTASPLALAIFSRCGLKDRLVHFDYNGIMTNNEPTWAKIHSESVLGAVQHYGYEASLFHDCQTNQDAAIESIARVINASSENDPLYWVLAGPMQIPMLGILKANADKRKFVHCISHSRWNDGFASKLPPGFFPYNKRDVIDAGVHWIQIRDQNRLLSLSRYGKPGKPEEFDAYSWMRDSSEASNNFQWDRMILSTRPDPSDAGMAWFLTTGDEECSPEKLRSLLVDHKPPMFITSRSNVRIEAENFRHLTGCKLEDRGDRTASHRLAIRRLGAESDAGRISTLFIEPFTSVDARYDVEVRYSVAPHKHLSMRLTVNGVLVGQPLDSQGTDEAWATYAVRDVAIHRLDEIAVDFTGAGRFDYIQLNRRSE
jgi:predicted amidohydrolase